ncbi:helix-turn-helix domain-containing protein [Agrobacterium fabrum]|uniref:helix-turn-helix transcriptional regulator n=1 Tax=Agrobacterium fabrum TaxID=1176649 RepID=UPI0021CF06CD|nr:helix-turn-helix domain-containing protein [Agrobacterium fabrum]UXT56945.1 helix-turn-helix domain-containing protein [Agrobacterium fabrum]
MEKPTYLTAKEVCQRYGRISDMTLHRWLRDDRLNFPRPVRIGGLRFFDLAELAAYDEQSKERGR